MTVQGTSNLPIGPRDMAWNAAGAKQRVFELATTNGVVNVASVGRAFLWRGDGDPRQPDVWQLGYCDVYKGRLVIVPKGLASAAGLRGLGSLAIPDSDKDLIRARMTTIYDKVRVTYDTWPQSPFALRASLTADATGTAFEGVIAFEGTETGVKRMIAKNALTWEDGPWPLVFNRDEMGHVAPVVGTVNEIFREGSEIRARGSLSESEDPETALAVLRVAELFQEGAVGVLIFTDDDDWDEKGDVMIQTAGRIRHVAVVDVPAFSQARLGLTAAIPVKAEWFANPTFGYNGDQAPGSLLQGDHDERLVLQEPEHPDEERQFGAPLHVTDDGQIFGHAWLWSRCHVGFAKTCVKPPREPASFRGYLTGERVPGIPTGVLVLGTTHAGLSLSADAARTHYDHSGYGIADIALGSDIYGGWVAGAIRSDATPEQVEVLRGSALSGDWRPVGGRLRLVGMLVVSSPGFRVARAVAASGSLITVGPGCDLCDEHLSLEERVAALEARFPEGLVAGA